MRILLAAVALSMAAIAAPANAASYLFLINGPIEAAFNLDSDAAVAVADNQVEFTAIPGYFDGLDDVANVRFGTDPGNPAVPSLTISLSNGGGFSLFGDQLFNGPAYAGAFVVGDFLLVSPDHGDPVLLSIIGEDGISGTVPEPASWALLTLGFGIVGRQLRRRAAAA